MEEHLALLAVLAGIGVYRQPVFARPFAATPWAAGRSDTVRYGTGGPHQVPGGPMPRAAIGRAGFVLLEHRKASGPPPAISPLFSGLYLRTELPG